jgi:hypothetical protein
VDQLPCLPHEDLAAPPGTPDPTSDSQKDPDYPLAPLKKREREKLMPKYYQKFRLWCAQKRLKEIETRMKKVSISIDLSYKLEDVVGLRRFTKEEAQLEQRLGETKREIADLLCKVSIKPQSIKLDHTPTI